MITLSSFIAFLTNVIQDEPGFIVGPISWVLGTILNFVFEAVYFFTENFSLGISIIVVTIVARCLMLPLAFKQQKSMVVMRKIQPEIRKIQDKYKDDMADPEVKRKMNMEMQKLYSKHKYNPFSGCLPLIIQLPIFIALYYIMQNSYAFIDTINETYTEISSVIIENVEKDKDEGLVLIEKQSDVQNIINKAEKDRSDDEKLLLQQYENNNWVIWYNFAGDSENGIRAMVPEDMNFDVLSVNDLPKALDKFTSEQWDIVKKIVPDGSIDENINKKENIEYFGFGINLTEVAGFTLPGVIITLLSGLTTFLSSWLMMRKNKGMGNETVQSQQKIMLVTMPLIMAWITSGLPCGVGLYWIISNIFMIVQQQALNKYYENKLILEGGNSKNIIEEPPTKKGKSKR